MSDNDNVIRFQAKLNAKLNPSRHLDRKAEICRILAKAIGEMNDLGASFEEVAGTLRHAVEILEGTDE
jgi:hypothetical protein